MIYVPLFVASSIHWEEAVVEIPSPAELWYDILEDNNIFYAEIASPNQGADQYAFNNELSAPFEFPQIVATNNITVEFRTNNAPNQNSYQLLDSDGNIVGSNNLLVANNTFTDDYELSDGCYKF